jgi:hypothetical protein
MHGPHFRTIFGRIVTSHEPKSAPLARSVTKLPYAALLIGDSLFFCSLLLTSAHLCSPLLPERSVNFTVAIFRSFYLLILDDGTYFGSEIKKSASRGKQFLVPRRSVLALDSAISDPWERYSLRVSRGQFQQPGATTSSSIAGPLGT